MESANYHHRQQEDTELVDASPFPTPSYSLAWPEDPLLTSTNNRINSRNIVPCLDTGTMVQDLGCSWITGTNNGTGYPIESFVTHELQRLAKIKDEFSVGESYPKFLELLNCSPSSSIQDLYLYPYPSYLTNDHDRQFSYANNNQDFTSFSSGCPIEGGQLINNQNCSNRTFSKIFPTISISSSNQSSSSSSSTSPSAISSTSFDKNCLPALNLSGSPKFDGSYRDPTSLSANNLCSVSHCLDRMHQPSHRPSVCDSKISSVSTTRSTYQSSKRPASRYIDAKPTQSVVPKKSKFESRPSSAPFQVRKEKLGDRIAAIQQLVAPFGKTDTASVLMEAIGYIKFLQTQLETLSVPYMKSTDKFGGTSSQECPMGDGDKEAKRDLRSRGLCLVPLSCLIITDGGDGIWPVT